MSDVGGPKTGLMNIGEEAKPPFAVLPDPSTLFLGRAKRLEALAADHPLEPYLRFLSTVTRAQHDIVPDLPAAALPAYDRIRQAFDYGMPPVAKAVFTPDETTDVTIVRLLERLKDAPLPDATSKAITTQLNAARADRATIVTALLSDAPPIDAADIAERTLIAAGLQVHFSRLAAQFEADKLKRISDGACPVCGSLPMTSSVVGWPKAHNTRFCTCGLCATMWNVVRVKCVLCSSTGGIAYRLIDGLPETVKAETCDTCESYVKILYQVNDAALEPMADDVASLGLDVLMSEDGWKRGGHNPFLVGY